jgi:hypothetical protein
MRTLKKKKTTERVSEEANAYTPGLKVKMATIVSKMRRLPMPGEVYVKVGDEVNFDTTMAVTQAKGDPEVVKASVLLGIEDDDLPPCMKKKIGEKVANGEVIASYTALFGLLKKRVSSPIDGTIESISDSSGQVVIRGLPVPVEIEAYIPGKVVEVLPKLGAVIETNAAFIQGIFGIGGETHGKIRIAVDSPDEELTADHITPEDKGVVVVGGSLATLEAIKRGVEVGVSCIVAGGIRHKDMMTFMGEEIGVAITGQEEVGLTLIITEGFGKMKMSQRTFNLLKRFEGHMACVNGATQIRAGVQRPEIIIPHEESLEQASGAELAAGMVPGTLIRIIRQPHFGAIGKVVRLPVDLKEIQTKSYVRVLDVELEDGKVVTVPRANVEIIEE